MWVSLFTTLKAGHSELAWGDYGAWTDAPKDWKTCQNLFSTWSEGHLVHESCKSPDSSIFSRQGRKLLLGKCRDSMVFVPIKLGGNIFILDFYVSRHIKANSKHLIYMWHVPSADTEHLLTPLTGFALPWGFWIALCEISPFTICCLLAGTSFGKHGGHCAHLVGLK